MVDELFLNSQYQTGPIYLSNAANVPECCYLCAHFHVQPGLSVAALLVNCFALVPGAPAQPKSSKRMMLKVEAAAAGANLKELARSGS